LIGRRACYGLALAALTLAIIVAPALVPALALASHLTEGYLQIRREAGQVRGWGRGTALK
jgi:hypothetical protein